MQGVGYRAFTWSTANKLQLHGWVKNKDDGSVEAIIEGEEEKLRTVITRCQQGPPASRVDHIQSEWGASTGEFQSFSIVED